MSNAGALLDRAALEAQAREERRHLLIDAGLAGFTLVGLVSAVILAAAGVAGIPLVIVFVVTYLAGGVQAFGEALRDLRHGRLDIDLLMVLAALAAAAVGQPRDGAFLLLLFSLANVLENFAMGRTKRAVTSLMDLRPDEANLVRGDELESVPVEQLAIGDVVLVRPGEYLPVDGTIVSGDSAIDQSAITGESVPVDRTVGDPVFAGTVNKQGALTIRVDKSANTTTLARMITLVTEAQAQRAPSQQFSDWFGQRYTLAVLVGSAAALAGFLLFGLPSSEAFYKTATLLVVASPCAIVISVPAAILSALAGAARRGILFKGGAALETFGAVSVMAFDKTGTLTTGTLTVTDVVPVRGEVRDLLQLAADLEHQSGHPIARSVIAAARAAGISPTTLNSVQAHPGFGVSAVRSGDQVWAGNARFAESFGAAIDTASQLLLSELANDGKTPVILGRGTTLEGVIAVADSLRPNAREALAQLAQRGIARHIMLTGDHREVARAIGARLGLPAEAIRAELLPEQKVEEIRKLDQHGKVAFVGDGVNDAAALASAELGIAMGTMGSDAALEAADVALLSDDLRLLADAHTLARRANRIIRQNLIFAIGIMAVMVLITLFGQLPLPLGVIGHEGGTLLVVFNGLRLLLPNRDSGQRGQGQSQPVAAPGD